MPSTDMGQGLQLDSLVDSWKLSLEARNLSTATTYIYGRGLDVFRTYLAEAGLSGAVGAIRREHIEAALVWMGQPTAERPPYSDHTIGTFYDGVASFWKWATAEGEVERNPMANMTKPIIPETPVDFPTAAELRRMLKPMEGGRRSFADRRDAAIIRLFTSTGLRLSELANIRWDVQAGESPDLVIDAKRGEVSVMGKGRKPRTVSFGVKAAQALDAYRRARSEHPNAELPWFWISDKGRMTTSGIRQMLGRRGKAVGVDVGPHTLRHYFIHEQLRGDPEAGIQPKPPETVARLLGHSSTKMIQRTYGASLAMERANEANRYDNPGDRL
jgi:integrase